MSFTKTSITPSIVWASTFCTAGFLLGTVLESILVEVERYELIVLGVIVAGGVVAWLVHMRIARYRRKTAMIGDAVPVPVQDRPEAKRDV